LLCKEKKKTAKGKRISSRTKLRKKSAVCIRKQGSYNTVASVVGEAKKSFAWKTPFAARGSIPKGEKNRVNFKTGKRGGCQREMPRERRERLLFGKVTRIYNTEGVTKSAKKK